MKPKKFPNPALAAVTVVALIGALVGGYLFLIAPKRHEAARLGKEIADVQGQLDAARIVPHATGTPIRVADIFRLSRAMPDTADVPDVLLQLSQIAKETGIKFQSITPGDLVQQPSFSALPISLIFQGHFYDLADFLYRLRNLVGVHGGTLTATGRLFSVDSISFAEGDLLFPEVQATIQVNAYVYGNGTSTTAPAPSSASAAGAPAVAAPVTTTPGGTTPAATTPTATTPSSTAPTETGTQPVPATPAQQSGSGQ